MTLHRSHAGLKQSDAVLMVGHLLLKVSQLCEDGTKVNMPVDGSVAANIDVAAATLLRRGEAGNTNSTVTTLVRWPCTIGIEDLVWASYLWLLWRNELIAEISTSRHRIVSRNLPWSWGNSLGSRG